MASGMSGDHHRPSEVLDGVQMFRKTTPPGRRTLRNNPSLAYHHLRTDAEQTGESCGREGSAGGPLYLAEDAACHGVGVGRVEVVEDLAGVNSVEGIGREGQRVGLAVLQGDRGVRIRCWGELGAAAGEHGAVTVEARDVRDVLRRAGKG